MTDAQTENAKQVRQEAAAWLERRQRPEWCAQDQAALEAWLAAAPTNTVSYLRVEAAWNRANRLGALRQPMRMPGAKAAPRRSLTRFLTMAAAVTPTRCGSTRASAGASAPNSVPSRAPTWPVRTN